MMSKGKGVIRCRINKKGIAQRVRVHKLKKWNEKWEGFIVSSKYAGKTYDELVINGVFVRPSVEVPVEVLPTETNEIVIYGLLINSEDHDKYSYLEIAIYTKEDVSLVDVFRAIESTGNYLIRPRDSSEDRVKIAKRTVSDFKGKVSEDWESDLLNEISSLGFVSRTEETHKRSRVKLYYEKGLIE